MPAFRPCAAVVVWHPDLAILSSVLAAVCPQVAEVLLVANDGAAPAIPLPDNVVVEVPDTNVGLGAAYNQAMRWARERAATHLLLLDQDSVVSDSLVATLAAAYRSDQPVAAAGPLWRDRRTGRDGYFVRIGGWGVRKVPPTQEPMIPVDFLISSGSLIALAAAEKIGPFDERLFIDHIDTEWCLRARHFGFQLIGLTTVRLDHGIGEATMPVRLFGRALFVQPPRRNYFLLRNSIVLWRRPYAPLRWVQHDIRRVALVMVLHLLFVPPRRERFKAMRRAIVDAIHFDANASMRNEPAV